MIRRRQVYPDESGVVTREALLEAMIDAATFLDFAGGVLSVVTQRQPTGLPGEMVTTGAVVEWRHDARVQPRPEQFEAPGPQPEPVSPDSPGVRVPERMVGVGLLAGEEPEMERAESASDDQPESGPEPDGFEYSRLDEEDVEEPVATT